MKVKAVFSIQTDADVHVSNEMIQQPKDNMVQFLPFGFKKDAHFLTAVMFLF